MVETNREVLKGRKNATPYSVEVNFLEKDILSVDLYFGDDPAFGVMVGSYFLKKRVGPFNLDRRFNEGDLKIIPEITRWSGEIRIEEEHQGEGLSQGLVRLALNTLELAQGLHVETFTSCGMERIAPQFLRKGYQVIWPKSKRFPPLFWKRYS